MSIVNVLAEDKKLVTYRPRLNEITDSVTATVLLQQIIFHTDNVGYRPFYKFRAPCGHKLYREGDSWTEELGFSPAEFDTARSKIATRIKKGDSKTEALKGEGANHLVIYWTDSSRVTWYQLNVDLLNKILEKLYADSRNSNYQEDEEGSNSESLDSEDTGKFEKGDLPSSEIPSEIPKENTKKTSEDFPEKPKERTDDEREDDHPDGYSGRARGVDADGGERADAGEPAADFRGGYSVGVGDGKADPLLMSLDRATLAKREELGGNHAVPPPAGGSFALGDRLITVACARLGRSEPEGEKCRQARAFFKKVLEAEGLLQGDEEMLARAIREWLNPEGDYTFYLSQYALTPKHELALRHLGIVLSKAKAQAAAQIARRAYDMEATEASLAALEERRAARAPPVDGDMAWEAAKVELALQMTRATFDAWIRRTYGLGREDGVYTVVAPDALARDWLESRLKTTAERTLVGILDESVEVRFEVGE